MKTFKSQIVIVKDDNDSVSKFSKTFGQEKQLDSILKDIDAEAALKK